MREDPPTVYGMMPDTKKTMGDGYKSSGTHQYWAKRDQPPAVLPNPADAAPPPGAPPLEGQRVAVVGAGLAGLCTAWALERRGATVTVYEAAAEPATGASFANAGRFCPARVLYTGYAKLSTLAGGAAAAVLPAAAVRRLSPDGELPTAVSITPGLLRWASWFARNCTPARGRANNDALSGLARRAAPDMERVMAEAGIQPADISRADGNLWMHKTPGQFDDCPRRVRDELDGSLELLSAEQCAERFPGVGELVAAQRAGCAVAGTDWSADARALSIRVAAALNGDVLYNRKVAQVESGVRYKVWEVTGEDRRQYRGLGDDGCLSNPATGVANTIWRNTLYNIFINGRLSSSKSQADQTPYKRGPVVWAKGQPREFDYVVLCCGSRAPELLSGHGCKLPLAKMRGLSIDLHGVQGAPPLAVADYGRPLMSWQLTPLGGDAARVVGFADLCDGAPAADDAAAQERALLEHTRNVLPGMKWAGSREPYFCHRPMTPDSLPVISPAERGSRVWVCCGLGAIGWTLSATVGELTADGLAHDVRGEVAPHLAPFSAERFSLRSYWSRTPAPAARADAAAAPQAAGA